MADEFITTNAGTPAQRRTWARVVSGALREEAAEKRTTANKLDTMARQLDEADVEGGLLPADVLVQLLEESVGVDLVAALLGSPDADVGELQAIVHGGGARPREPQGDPVDVDWTREPATPYEEEVRALILYRLLAQGGVGWVELLTMRSDRSVGSDLDAAVEEAKRLLAQRVADRHERMVREAQADVERLREAALDGNIKFAPTTRVNAHAEFLDDFIGRVLRMDPDTTLVSDELFLDEFPEPVGVYVERIREVYGVDVGALENPLLATVLEAVAERRGSQQ
jgi:hypothetical protein